MPPANALPSCGPSSWRTKARADRTGESSDSSPANDIPVGPRTQRSETLQQTRRQRQGPSSGKATERTVTSLPEQIQFGPSCCWRGNLTSPSGWSIRERFVFFCVDSPPCSRVRLRFGNLSIVVPNIDLSLETGFGRISSSRLAPLPHSLALERPQVDRWLISILSFSLLPIPGSWDRNHTDHRH